MNKKLLWSALTYAARRDTGWGESLLWGAASGALVGEARIVGQRFGAEVRQHGEKRHGRRRALKRIKS